MLEKIDTQNLLSTAQNWTTEHFLTTNTLYQGILLLSAFVLGSFTYHIVRAKAFKAIENSKMPRAARRISNNLVRLLFPLISLSILFIGSQIAKTETIGVNTALTEGIMKVLLAWIIIRMAVQFIANSAIRNFFAFVIWSIAALSIFGFLNQTMTTLDSISFSIGDFRLSALIVIKSVLSLFTLLYLAIFASSFAERRIFRIKSLTRSSQVLLAKVIRVVLIVFALLVGVTSAGIDLSLFAVFGGAIGLGIGFGLQKGISNLFSGMLLLMDQSIKPGDVLELENGTFGWVNQMAARYTEIVTRDNKSFLIPNEELITQRVVNWSHGNSSSACR
ncbi:MAG: mechanosensitive ion channel [Rhodospirillales bacterium]|nr:mechanosensitive ion channel [Rhodospirillales bacterium]